MSESVRAFIAIEIPESVQEILCRIQSVLKGEGLNLRWVNPANLHLTLKFLGDTPVDSIDAIREKMVRTAKSFEPFTLQATGTGVFPGIKRPRVVWAGIAGNIRTLIDLHHQLDKNLAELGIPSENRPFNAHLTIGRVKGKISTARLERAMAITRHIASDPFIVDQVILFQSDLKPTGPVYTKLANAVLQQ